MSEIQVLLTVQSIENNEASNGRKFQTVVFSENKFLGTMQIKTRNIRTRNLWDVSTDGKVRADGYYNNLRIGDIVEGQVIRFNTTPYKVGERMVTEWTGIVFSDENPVKYANSQLKNNEACVLDEHGSPTADVFVVKTPESVPAGTPAEEKF